MAATGETPPVVVVVASVVVGAVFEVLVFGRVGVVDTSFEGVIEMS